MIDIRTCQRWTSSVINTVIVSRKKLCHMSPISLVTIAAIVITMCQIVMFINSKCPSVAISDRIRFYRQFCNDPSYAKSLSWIYVITPTYARSVQKAELTRLSHTLMLVPNLHWIIVEDSEQPGDLVTSFVYKLKNDAKFDTITQLHAKTPDNFKLKPGDASWKYPKGVWQRNRALDWLRANMDDLDQTGAVYFGDDDNTYDLALFDEIRDTQRVSVWPVGLAGGLLVEKPIVIANKVVAFNSMWKRRRPFPLDMAGFAVGMQLLRQRPSARFSADQEVGYVESHFLGQLVSSWSELEPRASGCRRVLVWHTKTQRPALHEEVKLSLPSYADMDL